MAVTVSPAVVVIDSYRSACALDALIALSRNSCSVVVWSLFALVKSSIASVNEIWSSAADTAASACLLSASA